MDGQESMGLAYIRGCLKPGGGFKVGFYGTFTSL